AAAAAAAASAAEGGFDFEFEVVGEPLDLVPGAPVPVHRAQAELGEVGQEDVGEVDQDRAAARLVQGDDRQGHQDRVGVVLLDRLVERCAEGGLVVDVASNKLDAIADAAKDQDRLIVADGHTSVGHASGNRDRYQERLVELLGPDLGIQVRI